MIIARCVEAVPRTIFGLIICILFPALSISAGRWDSGAAARSFQDARQKRAALSETSQPTAAQYLECARAYRNVYVSDPHFGRAGDAIYEEGLVYQEAAERFLKQEYFQTAARRYALLAKDYSGNQNCKDALIRLASIYSDRLHDETAAQEVYKRLKKYGYSGAALKSKEVEEASGSDPNLMKPAEERKSPAASSAAAAASSSIVQNVRFWTTPEYTRVIIDMDSDAKYQKSRISNPDRVFFDIDNSRLTGDLQNRVFAVGDPILKQIRVAQKQANTVRVVFDMAALHHFTVSELHDPFRIVIDLHGRGSASPPVSKRESVPEAKNTSLSSVKAAEVPPRLPPMAVTEIEETAAKQKAPGSEPPAAGPVPVSEKQDVRPGSSTPPPPPPQTRAPGTKTAPAALSPATSVAEAGSGPTAAASRDIQASSKQEKLPAPKQAVPTSHGDRTLTRMLGLKVGRIVLDPGHGGHDFGTVGPGGLLEKNLVLLLARSLRKMIEENLGAEVILTREDDRFVTLEDRTSIANQSKADLFISLHANSSRIHSISGVETYYLDFAKNDAEREIAARENASSVKNVSDLEDLIKKIARADKSAESRELASIIQTKMYAGSRQILRSTQNRGVRSAPFVVLIGANMPSVLAEVAFISNPKDERLLNKESTRQNLVRALYAGIEGYMKTLGSDLVNNQKSSQSR